MKRRKTTDLSAKQERVATLLGIGTPVRTAARQAGVSERVIYTWQRDAAFRALVSRHRSALVDETIGALAGVAVAAVETLGEMLRSEESDAVKVKAALGILAQFVRLRDHSELEDRFAQLEARIDRGD